MTTPFPDRPDHDDFKLMSEIVRELDALGDNSTPLPEIITDPDLASLLYMAEQRALRVERMLASMDSPLAPDVVYTSLWLEAFKIGIEFQKRRDPRPANGDSSQN